MVVGLGGVTVEVLRDVAIRLLPVDETTARDMLRSLRSAPCSTVPRPARRATSRASCAPWSGLSRVFLDHRDALSDIEINPMIVLAEGRRRPRGRCPTVRRPRTASQEPTA